MVDPVLLILTDISRILYSSRLPETVAYPMLRDSLSSGQMKSKLEALRIIQNSKLKFNSGLFLAHWHGLFPRLLRNFGLFKNADGHEIDPEWVEFSNLLNADWSWSSVKQNAETAPQAKYDLVVNTSCEHMGNNWMKQIQANTYVLAQTTNYAHSTHINTCTSLYEMHCFCKSLKVQDG